MGSSHCKALAEALALLLVVVKEREAIEEQKGLNWTLYEHGRIHHDITEELGCVAKALEDVISDMDQE